MASSAAPPVLTDPPDPSASLFAAAVPTLPEVLPSTSGKITSPVSLDQSERRNLVSALPGTNDETLPALPSVPSASSGSSAGMQPLITISPRPDLPNQSTPWISVLSDKEVPHRMPSARVHNGVIQSNFPVELLKDQAPLWSSFIAGYFIGDDSPHIGKVHATVNRLWTTYNKKTKIDAQFISPKIVLFKIEDDLMRRRVLQRHFWHVADIPMIVQQWSPSSAGKPPDLSSIPLWVDFLRVPESLYSKRGLLFLGNLVGKSQKLHPSTERCSRFDVARVLVEVNLNSDLPSLIKLEGESDVSIPIVYPWLPPRCLKCSCWGHKSADCVSKAGAPLADSNAGKHSGPEQSSIPKPTNAPVQPTPITDPACPVDESHSKQVNTPVQRSPVQGFSPALHPAHAVTLVQPMMDSFPVQSNISSGSSPLLQATPTLQDRTTEAPVESKKSEQNINIPGAEINIIQSMNQVDQLSSIEEHQPQKVSPLACEQESNWTVVTKPKGSPSRTIMTRGKCVATGEVLPSRYQILEKEQLNLDDIEDGELLGEQHDEPPSESDDIAAYASQSSSQGDENRATEETNIPNTRRKGIKKAIRQTNKSKKSSFRKA